MGDCQYPTYKEAYVVGNVPVPVPETAMLGSQVTSSGLEAGAVSALAVSKTTRVGDL